ncbi:MAG: glycosyltransferase family 9 protein [Alphaproteobacteria bacterium]|nr:glycosyltransferase family 9 protein [Alphaproteobacteria bacterium]
MTAPTSGPTAAIERPRILVIKLGALGDVVQAGGPFAAIRREHADAHITLLTTLSFVPLLEQSPWFDEIWIDDRPKFWQLRRWRALKQSFAGAKFQRVYDLQTSDRSGLYFRMLPQGTEWSGIVGTGALRHDNPRREFMHTVDRQIDQLALAGILNVPFPDFRWLKADVSEFGLASPYALLVPGGSAHRREKRWPIEHFKSLGWHLLQRGITPVVIGGPAEAGLGRQVVRASGSIVDLTGQTNYAQIYQLARDAVCAVGNDTGPMHLVAASGTPTIVLFSHASDPGLCAPRAPVHARPVTILRRNPLSGLSVNEVEAELSLG